MVARLGTPVGRLMQGTFGIALLLIGIAQVSVPGLMLMMTGLIATVAAATCPLRVRLRD